MDNLYKINGKSVYSDKELFIAFASNVQKIISLENSIVILLDNNSSLDERNIFCYNFKKQLKWQIPSPVKIHKENYYTGIYLRGNELYAYSRSGVEYYLDKETGAILNSELVK